MSNHAVESERFSPAGERSELETPVIRFRSLFIAYSLSALLLVSAAVLAESLQPGMYEVTVRLVMPHLEENLRYAITYERRCIQRQDLPFLFPILRQAAFEGCSLGDLQQNDGYLQFPLQCKSQEVATGTARFLLAPERITGELKIRMGGKNMTFSQRIEATRRGECEAK